MKYLGGNIMKILIFLGDERMIKNIHYIDYQ